MNDLGGQPGELRFTVSIKRKETGKVETYDVVGKIGEESVEGDSIKQQQPEKKE